MGLGFLFEAKDMASGVMGHVRDSMREVSGVSEEMKASLKSNFTEFGKGVALMGVGALVMAGVFDPASEVTKNMSEAIALVATEADTATFSQDRMRDVATNLAQVYGHMPVDEAKALYKAVALGADDAAKSTAFLTGVNLLAVAGNADLEMTTNALGGALNAYSESFDRATDYSDALFVAMKKGNTTVQDLAGAIGRVTATAASLNVPIEEVLGGVSVMTNKGVAAAEAVSGLKEALANVIHPSEKARAEAARLGVQFNQTELRSKGLQGFLKEIMGSANFNNTSFSKLFESVEGSNAILQITGGNMAAFNSTMEAMGNKAGSTQAGFEIMSKTLKFQEAQFKANKDALLDMIGLGIEPFRAASLGMANSIIKAITKLPGPIVETAAKIGFLVTQGVMAVGAFIALKAAFAVVNVGVTALFGSFAGLLAAIAPVIAVGAALVAAFYAINEAYETNFGGFADAVNSVFDTVKLTFTALAELFEGGGFTEDTWQKLEKRSGIRDFAIQVYMWFGRIQAFVTNFASGFTTAFDRLEPAFTKIVGAFMRLGAVIGKLLGSKDSPDEAASAFDRFAAAGAAFGDILGGVIASVGDYALPILSNLIDIVSGIIDGFMEGWAPAGKMMTSVLGVLWDQIITLLHSLGIMVDTTTSSTSGWEKFGYVVGVVGGVIGKVISGILDLVIGLTAAIVYMVNKFVEGLNLIKSGPRVFQSAYKFLTGTEDVSHPENAISAAPAVEPTFTSSASSSSWGGGITSPGVAASVATQTSGTDMSETNKHLAEISKNSSSSMVVNASFAIDGEVAGRATARAQKSNNARGFTPTPVEG